MMCSPADVTEERVHDLLGQGLVESLALEHKVDHDRKLVQSVAAMANTYGGMILVGVDDNGTALGGVRTTSDRIMNACHDTLDPPWEPEIIAVPMASSPNRFILASILHHAAVGPHGDTWAGINRRSAIGGGLSPSRRVAAPTRRPVAPLPAGVWPAPGRAAS